MRKSLWIIPLLFAAIVVPNANADSITDTTTTSFKFKCCNGETAKAFDLTVTIDLPAVGNPVIGITPPDATCVPTFANPFTATLTCADGIVTTDTIVESVTVKGTSAAKVLIANWSNAAGGIISPATPTPEPASIELVGIGIGLVLVMRKRYAQGLPQAKLKASYMLPAHH